MRALPSALRAAASTSRDDARAALVGIDQHLRAAQRFDVVASGSPIHTGLSCWKRWPRLMRSARMPSSLDVRRRRRRAASPASAPAARRRSRARPSASAWGSASPAIASSSDLRQQVGGASRPAWSRDATKRSPLASVVRSQLRPVDAGLGGETVQRPGRLAVGVQRDVEVRAEHFASAAPAARSPRPAAARPAGAASTAACASPRSTSMPRLSSAGEHAVEERLRQAGSALTGSSSVPSSISSGLRHAVVACRGRRCVAAPARRTARSASRNTGSASQRSTCARSAGHARQVERQRIRAGRWRSRRA